MKVKIKNKYGDEHDLYFKKGYVYKDCKYKNEYYSNLHSNVPEFLKRKILFNVCCEQLNGDLTIKCTKDSKDGLHIIKPQWFDLIRIKLYYMWDGLFFDKNNERIKCGLVSLLKGFKQIISFI